MFLIALVVSPQCHKCVYKALFSAEICVTVLDKCRTTLLEKYPTLFFCENQVDFNEARLNEAMNLHTHA
jgi:hypothetical protein